MSTDGEVAFPAKCGILKDHAASNYGKEYDADMADDPLINYLGQVCREAREAARINGRKLTREDLAVQSRGSRYAETSDGLRANALFRFENGTYKNQWPRNPDYLVQLYADAIGIAPRVFWTAALLRKYGPASEAESQQAATAAKYQNGRSSRGRSRAGVRRRPA